MDVLDGWLGGVGAPFGQAAQAVQFFQDLVSVPGVNPSAITFTGHSLGGGIAGLIAGLYGREAVIFDNMAFRLALDDLYEYATDPLSPYHAYINSTFYSGLIPWEPNTSQISGYRMDGQFLNFQSEGQTVGSNRITVTVH